MDGPKSLVLSQDYFSMTLLAFYIDDDELLSRNMEKYHLKKSKRYSEDEFATSLVNTIKQKRLQRRNRNNQILVNMSIIFALKLALVWYMIKYFWDTDFYEPVDISYIIVGYICCLINHFIMQPRLLSGIKSLKFIYAH